MVKSVGFSPGLVIVPKGRGLHFPPLFPSTFTTIVHQNAVQDFHFSHKTFIMAPKKNKTTAAASAAAKKQKGNDTTVVEVKKEAAATRAANFTPEEDVALAKAYASCTDNPLCGVEQKGSQFFGQVAEKFFVLMCQSDTLQIGEGVVKRSAASLKNRWSKHIQPEMNKFLPYLRKLESDKPSGTPKDQLILLAAEEYRYYEGSMFRFIQCVDILLQLPKFQTMKDKVSNEAASTAIDENGNAVAKSSTINSVADPMGTGMEHPMGNKRAKKEQFNGKVALADNKALQKMANSHSAIADSLESKHQKEALKLEYDMCMQLGDQVGKSCAVDFNLSLK